MVTTKNDIHDAKVMFLKCKVYTHTKMEEKKVEMLVVNNNYEYDLLILGENGNGITVPLKEVLKYIETGDNRCIY